MTVKLAVRLGILLSALAIVDIWVAEAEPSSAPKAAPIQIVAN